MSKKWCSQFSEGGVLPKIRRFCRKARMVVEEREIAKSMIQSCLYAVGIGVILLSNERGSGYTSPILSGEI